MITVLAFALVATFMTLIMTKRLSPLVALILIPTLFGLIAGQAAGLGDMMLEGVKSLAPTGIMLVFAILYFGLMIDAGLFEPIVDRIVSVIGDDPVRLMIGTVLLALTVGLDGDGTTTYMITIAAMLPLFRKLALDVRMLACLAIMSSAVSNMLPWGGPTARAATVLHLDPAALFLSLLPATIITALWVLALAWWFGRSERARVRAGVALAVAPATASPGLVAHPRSVSQPQSHRLFWLNVALTIALLAALMMGLLPLPVLFMIAYALALAINARSLTAQREIMRSHADNALSVGGLIFAAGIFTGVLNGTGMVDAMATAVTHSIPEVAGPYMAAIIALVSVPFTYLISNDAFYFGMLPVLAKAAGTYGFTNAEIARASLIGQQVHLLSPLVPSTYLLVGMVGIEFGDHQRFTLKWALVSCLVLFLAALATGAFAFHHG